MRLLHQDHPGRAVRLGYCLNVHAAETLDGVVDGLARVAGPVARALGGGRPFGVGPWLAALLARELVEDSEARSRLRAAVAQEGLVPFTFNAFPYGGFHAPGLKAGVYSPTWREAERGRFTAEVAGLAAELATLAPELGDAAPAHVSVSTHGGGFHTDVPDAAARAEVVQGLARAVGELARLEAEHGVRVVLSLEAEPRSSANDTEALPPLFAAVRAAAGPELARRHLGACLDACHAAVEFEEPAAALAAATADGHPLGKLQFSSALALDAHDELARTRLFALDEPVYLHQVTGRSPAGLVRAADLPEARAAWDADPAWRACDELRCHFHVPVDLSDLGAGLRTTTAFATALLDAALAAPDRWGSPELHVEVETYTWDVLPPEARHARDLQDDVRRELHHVATHLATRGWRPA